MLKCIDYPRTDYGGAYFEFLPQEGGTVVGRVYGRTEPIDGEGLSKQFSNRLVAQFEGESAKVEKAVAGAMAKLKVEA